MLLFIVRHGDPIYSTDSLTELGTSQAEALSHRFVVHGLDKIFTSPMNRAQLTAKPTCEALKIKPVVLDWMSEGHCYQSLSYKKADGTTDWIHRRPCEQLRSAQSMSVNYQNWYEAECFDDDRERYKQGVERIAKESDDFLAGLGYRREGAYYKITNPNEERVACFCHHGFGTTWLSHLLNIPLNVFITSFDINLTGVTVLEFSNNKSGYTAPKCLQFSDVSHLLKADLPYQFGKSIDL